MQAAQCFSVCWEGSSRERKGRDRYEGKKGSSREVKIEHAAADAVEEMLEHMYTSIIPCKVEPA